MAKSTIHTDIRKHLDAGRAHEAKMQAQQALKEAPDADLHYLHGLACARLGEYHHAINAFNHAERLNPDSPAVHAKAMLNEIYAFRNMDLINP